MCSPLRRHDGKDTRKDKRTDGGKRGRRLAQVKLLRSGWEKEKRGKGKKTGELVSVMEAKMWATGSPF